MDPTIRPPGVPKPAGSDSDTDDPTLWQEKPPLRAGADARAEAPPSFESASCTHPGKVRRINEDACLDRAGLGLWAVADGVGGWHAGDRASGLVVERLRMVENSGGGAALLGAVREQLQQANAQLVREAAASGRPSATTVVVLLISGRHFACAWAGDSRLYLWRGGKLRQVTRDHTEAQAMADAGLMTLEEAERIAGRNAIARAVGAGEALELEMRTEPAEEGDLFLLCTDGLTKMLSDQEIAASLVGAPPDAAVKSLLAQSLDRGGIDNVTIVAVRFGQVRASEP
jgi:serine/threonine protein phosphatase PrpC